MKKTLHEKLEVLKKKGHFLTSSRLMILDYLSESTSHPTAEEIYNALRNKLPSLSRATVYNTLKLFIDLGVAREVKVERDKSRFEVKTDPHIHFCCVKCNSVYDIEKEIIQFPKHIEGNKVMFGDLFLYGICASCQKKEFS
ncbi:MAG: Fur family transcriptional regulator [Candidatus Hydrothermales bacterium]